MALFQQSIIKKHLESLDKNLLENKWNAFTAIFHLLEKQNNIRNSKEEQYQEGFLRDLFVQILGYTINPETNFNLLTEQKNVSNAKKADGAILIYGKVKAVIELKGTDTTDLAKIETQAFGYKNNQPECVYVITSNFEKLRFYIENAVDFIEFNLFKLTKQEFELLYVCLSFENIQGNIPKHLKDESVSNENKITKQLYKDYSEFKRALFNNLVAKNTDIDKLLLFKKTQKLLDRFLFIFFAEDRQLVPTNLIRRINLEWENLQKMRIPVSLYERYKIYFEDLNSGAKVTLPAFGKKTGDAITAEFEIFAYNGGLFAPDEILDNVQIDDEILHKHTIVLSDYDFDSDVDVNILGHIFENSLNEIDEIKSELEGKEIDKTKTRRKKDGVFYTPKYITKYIVDNTVGKLCTEKKEELQLLEEEYNTDKNLQTKTKKALLDKLTTYRNWLLELTICDPACGSGAFLNQALEFLIAEHRYVDELQAKLMGDAMVLSDVETSILEKNLYGVDLNDESIEIAKLSLWLRTAQKGRKLNSLNNNIKCGNSLIDDPEIAGEKAFSWEKEFPEVFAKSGFDVIIGNPPYVSKTFDEILKIYFKENYKTAQYQLELYVLFMELSVEIINKNGISSYIIPNSWMKNIMFSQCREFLLKTIHFELIIPNLDNVFSDANVDTCIFILTKNLNIDEIQIGEFLNSNFLFKHNVSQKRLCTNERFIFDLEINDKTINIFNKIDKKSIRLEDICDITRGINPYDKYRGQSAEIISSKAYHSDYKKDDTFVPELRGKHINRFIYTWDNLSYVSYGEWLAAPREKKYFEGERILCRQVLSTHLNCCIISEDFIIDQSVFVAKLFDENSKLFNAKYILLLLTSKLISYYFRNKANEFDALFPKIKIGEFKSLPVMKCKYTLQIPFTEKADKMLVLNKDFLQIIQKFTTYFSSQYNLEKLSGKLEKWYELSFVDFIKELNKAIKAVKGTPLTKKDEFEWMDLFEENKKNALEIKAEIDKTDKEIDQMVYALYGLTEEEIKIICDATS
jgi:type I restriction-modification system DNA methylase subunit/transcriptional regulator